MNIENISIEGTGSVIACGQIIDDKLDISCSDEDLLNKRYFLTIYETDEEFNKREQVYGTELNMQIED